MLNRCLIRIFLVISLTSLTAAASPPNESEKSPLLYDIGSPSMTKNVEPEPQPVSKEVAGLLRDLESKVTKTRTRAAKIATKTVFSEDILYQTIEAKLKAGYKIRPDDKYHVDEMSWYCKALAATGKAKYSAVLREAAAHSPSTKIQRYAGKSLTMLPARTATPARTVPVTAPPSTKLNSQENQLLTMLNATSLQTVRNAGKRIYRSPRLSSAVYDAVEKKILQLLPRAGSGRLASDTIAWLCKALIISEDLKYIPTMEKVEAGNGSASLRNHARRARERLEGAPEEDDSSDSI